MNYVLILEASLEITCISLILSCWEQEGLHPMPWNTLFYET